ncbi:leucyl/phenylalanyl-tRNA--protein transferase [Chitinivorax tropicus]|uniref:Leucyl/phenylalanyl-tRNA--protein transferase n=1 Tax=Chitinivorax tropicus TaxID=714531 RepID=A0A840MQ57_9PROT|nr:leucyl/phenylalanyl-tRNA--protein transferase [Chitinivorax tropicus]MBB5019197.1 leucyl/phenylalanyl-tRNA--protein transferase [Chitinivorax tropicus]
MLRWLGPTLDFPPLEAALIKPNGLLAMGGDLSASRILSAYRNGIFPWFNEGEPILWWSPDPRMVLFPDELRITRSLSKTLRNKPYAVTVDTCFREVMTACAAPRGPEGGTWITTNMIDAYCMLHSMGFAHSIECWMDGELAGGLYGMAIGKMFYGESMFAKRTDASKIAFVHLVRQLARWEFSMIDCQMRTDHLASLGGREIARSEFAARLKVLVEGSHRPGPWQFEPHNVLIQGAE